MVTIKQALTNTHGVSIKRTIKDIKVGEAFKWKVTLNSTIQRSDVWCVRLKGSDLLRVELCENGVWKTKEYVWCYLEGPLAGKLLYDDGFEEIHQP